MWWSYRPYVSVAERRAKAAKQMAKLEKGGRRVQPVRLEGKKIAQTFWGKAWCDHLESFSDYSNRLPRGRTYVRNGSVCDLQIEPGGVTARVCGSELYTIQIKIKPVSPGIWGAIKGECAGQIGSLIELLQGKLSAAVMQIITRRDGGLFPKPAEIELKCSCPDWANMCKHVAATLYGVGARLDEQPELLFLLRKVDHLDLITQAGDVTALTKTKTSRKKIAAGALSDVFGIELDAPDQDRSSVAAPAAKAGKTRIPDIAGESATVVPSAARKNSGSRKPRKPDDRIGKPEAAVTARSTETAPPPRPKRTTVSAGAKGKRAR